MTKYINTPVVISGNRPVETPIITSDARERTIAYRILRKHDDGEAERTMNIRFDALISHDITYVAIIQTARASGLREFKMPYVLTNCHNSLCAVGGTINEDDHVFGLSAAKKYGGIYVPPNQAVIHQYAREEIARCGSMILGSDSHTRYGCYGSMGVGEGGGELAKQLLDNYWSIDAPEVVLVWLEGTPRRGVGPHDVALSLVAETFKDGRVKNKILEFAGPGVSSLSMDFRAGIDVMTTETSCLSSIWITDERVRDYYVMVGRPDGYSPLGLMDGAGYDAVVNIDLSAVECMIALPFHPSKAVTIRELQKNPYEILGEVQKDAQAILGEQCDVLGCIKDGAVTAEQGVIVGCAGGMYENVIEAASILKGESIGDGYFDLSVYPASAPVSLEITRSGTALSLMESGAVVKPAFCGPCFGAGDTPSNNTLSIRHATRNFPNREGSKPGEGQAAFVALMDARSIAATAINGGVITAATDIEYEVPAFKYSYDRGVYDKRVYNGYKNPQPDYGLRLGPNIVDWPEMPSLEENLLLKLCAVIHDEVTTTDELIPSGETSSFRSNPAALAEFTLSRRVPDYVRDSKLVKALEGERRSGKSPAEAAEVLKRLGAGLSDTTIGSAVFAKKPGDGSAREQAASCQKVLGGFANIAVEYTTKRYRSNCINWGILPFTTDAVNEELFSVGGWVYVPNIRQLVLGGVETIPAKLVTEGETRDITLYCEGLSQEEREILVEGCLMNYYAKRLNN